MKIKQYKIYPFKKGKENWDKKSWWKVIVFDTIKDLRKAARTACDTCKYKLGGSNDCLGLTHRHSFKYLSDDFGNISRPKFKGEIGIILLTKSKTGGGVVSHEMTHAMFYTITSYTMVINFESSQWSLADEKMAGIVGNLVNSFYSQFLDDKLDSKKQTRLKILKKPNKSEV